MPDCCGLLPAKLLNYLTPVAIFLLGLGATLYYAFSTNYLFVLDASRGYAIYTYYQTHLLWHSMGGLYGLQNTCLLVTYLPARIQSFFHFSPEMFFKIYVSMIVACVPLLVYFLSRKLVGNYAVLCSLFVMGWVAFYQGGSFARLNSAIVVLLLLLLVLFSGWTGKRRLTFITILCVLLPVAHYGAALIALCCFLGVLGIRLITRNYAKVLPIILSVIILASSFFVWQVAINSAIDFTGRAQRCFDSMGVSSDDIQRYSGSVISVNGTAEGEPDSIPDGGEHAGGRDKVSQAALGVIHPDNDTSFTLNWWMFAFAWLTVMLQGLGLILMWRDKRIPGDYRWLTVFSVLATVLVFASPIASRGYGVEKAYYQAIVLTSPCLVLGGLWISKRLRIPAWITLLAVTVPYVVLMRIYGVIWSVLG